MNEADSRRIERAQALGVTNSQARQWITHQLARPSAGTGVGTSEAPLFLPPRSRGLSSTNLIPARGCQSDQGLRQQSG